MVHSGWIWLIFWGNFVWFLSTLPRERYINLDEPTGMYFCTNRFGCNSYEGNVACDSICPDSYHVYCDWNLKEWTCFSNMNFGLEMVNASVGCSVNPYGNWFQVDSCILHYDVAPNVRNSWLLTFYMLNFRAIPVTTCFLTLSLALKLSF